MENNNNNNNISISLDKKTVIRFAAAAILIIDVIFMLASYIRIDAISQISSLFGDLMGHSANFGDGKFTVFGLISFIRKLMVISADGGNVFGSYLLAIVLWVMHISAIALTVAGAVNIIRQKMGLGHTNGRSGTIIALIMAAVVFIAGIIVNSTIEKESGGFVSDIVKFTAAPFIVCILCFVYNIYFIPRLTDSIENEGPRYKKCSVCGEMYDYNSDVCTHCGAWRCIFCNTVNESYDKYCTHCGYENSTKGVAKNVKSLGGWVCKKCDGRNSDNARYCTTCGADREEPINHGTIPATDGWTCKNCGKKNNISANYCTGCGTAK